MKVGVALARVAVHEDHRLVLGVAAASALGQHVTDFAHRHELLRIALDFRRENG